MQQSSTTSKVLNIFAILCGLWFVLTSWCWFWLANVIFSYPIAIVGMILWYFAGKNNRSDVLNKIALWLHIAGFASSLVFLGLIYFEVIR